jgi:hypothetical protein
MVSHFLRWMMGSLIVLTGGLSVGSFAIFISSDRTLWLERSRMFRQCAFALVMLWVNVEVWGSVIHTLVTW